MTKQYGRLQLIHLGKEKVLCLLYSENNEQEQYTLPSMKASTLGLFFKHSSLIRKNPPEFRIENRGKLDEVRMYLEKYQLK